MKEVELEIKNDNLSRAEELCDAILENNQFDLGGLFYKAIINRKKENFQQALETHNTLINLMPGNAEYLAERGLTFHMLKDEKQALKDFTAAVELEPNNPYRYASRAFIKDFYGDHYGALEDYNKAIELDPEDAISLNNRGVIEEKIGRLEDARKSFDQSDALSGLDKKLQQIADSETVTPPPVKPQLPPQNTNPSTISMFLKTLGSLFTSARERRAFLKYLSGNK